MGPVKYVLTQLNITSGESAERNSTPVPSPGATPGKYALLFSAKNLTGHSGACGVKISSQYDLPDLRDKWAKLIELSELNELNKFIT